MAIDVTVLRGFTDSDGNFGNPPAVGSATPQATIYTPQIEIPFAGHPTVGVSWWLRENGWPINTLQVPAGIVQVSHDAGSGGDGITIKARSEWAPEFALHEFGSVDELPPAAPADFPDDTPHYLWAWMDQAAGS